MSPAKPRITVATRIYLPEPAAASFRLGAVVRRLVDGGADVLVLTSRARGGLRPTADAPATVRRWPALRDRSGYIRGYLPYLSFDVPLVVRLLLSRRADVVLVEPPPTTGAVVRAVCAIRRVPYVYFAPDIWSDAAGSVGSGRAAARLLRTIEAWAATGAQRVLAVNEPLAARLRLLAPRARIEVVGNGVDTRVFTSSGPTASSGRYALYAGTTSEWQGADVFVRAMATVRERMPGARLVFLGQGSAWEDLLRLAQELGVDDAVEFVESVPAAQAAEWLRGACVSVVSMKPGQGYDFAFPTKVSASLASGVPVIYSGNGPARELIASAPADLEAGALAAYDEHEVADLIEHFLQRPIDFQSRARLAAWADDHVSLDAVAQRAAAVLESVAGEAIRS